MPDVLLSVPHINAGGSPKPPPKSLHEKITIPSVTNETTVLEFKNKISNKIDIPIQFLTLIRSGIRFGSNTILGEESTLLDAGYDVVRNTNKPPILIINYTDYYLNTTAATIIQSRVRGNISRDESARWGYLTEEIKNKKWHDIEKSLLKEGFDTESINQFKKDHYFGQSKKHRSKKHRSKKHLSKKHLSKKHRSRKKSKK